MKNIACRFLLIFACFGIAGISCSKSGADTGSPTIALVSGDNLIANDTSVYEATTLHFKVHCKWNGGQNLTNLIVAKNGARIVDEGMNTKEFEKNIDFAKDSSTVDSIDFIIRDIKGNSASTSLRVAKKGGTAGGELIRYNNITLDAQSVTDGKGFLSLSNGSTYTLQSAYGIQGSISILYYYDAIGTDANTIASPGANIDASVFTGTYGLPNWTVINTTRFYQITLSQQEFEAITDPVFVVSSYSESSGKRKAKNLVAGDVYSFKDESTSKYGIFRVYGVAGQDMGSVTFSIVMQK